MQDILLQDTFLDISFASAGNELILDLQEFLS